MPRADTATVTDFHDSAAGKATRIPGEVADRQCGNEIVPSARRPTMTTAETGAGADWPGIAAVRVRLGVTLPSGRVAGRTDQVVHVVPLPPPAAEPAPLRACCGLPVESDKVDFVPLISGPPCTRCLLFALDQCPPPRSPRP
jgi:hypothetical protein